jgi:molybdate transport system substrate-binding protein
MQLFRPACLVALGTLIAASAWGCSMAGPSAAARTGTVVRVAAASDLRFVLDEIIAAFHKEYPNCRVQVSYGSSGNLATQIINGAPYDLFLSADIGHAQKLATHGLARSEDVFPYAIGQLAVWIPNSRLADLPPVNTGIQAMNLLTDSRIQRIAVANPMHAPYGQAAVEALRKAGIYEAVQSKLVFADNVSQAAQFVQSGAADAGMISLSLAISTEATKESKYWTVPQEFYSPLIQAGVILSKSGSAATAEKLKDYFFSSQTQALWEKHGYRVLSR